MTLEKCYKELEGDLKDAEERLLSPEIIRDAVKMFPADETFCELQKAFEDMDPEAAFLAAHTLKGICSTLSFTKLYASVCELTELLRPMRGFDGTQEALKRVEQDYKQTVKAAEKLD